MRYGPMTQRAMRRMKVTGHRNALGVQMILDLKNNDYGTLYALAAVINHNGGSADRSALAHTLINVLSNADSEVNRLWGMQPQTAASFINKRLEQMKAHAHFVTFGGLYTGDFNPATTKPSEHIWRFQFTPVPGVTLVAEGLGGSRLLIKISWTDCSMHDRIYRELQKQTSGEDGGGHNSLLWSATRPERNGSFQAIGWEAAIQLFPAHDTHHIFGVHVPKTKEIHELLGTRREWRPGTREKPGHYRLTPLPGETLVVYGNSLVTGLAPERRLRHPDKAVFASIGNISFRLIPGVEGTPNGWDRVHAFVDNQLPKVPEKGQDEDGEGAYHDDPDRREDDDDYFDEPLDEVD